MTADVIASGRAVLGIELGSTRIKACLIDPDGATLATANHGWEIDDLLAVARQRSGAYTESELDLGTLAAVRWRSTAPSPTSAASAWSRGSRTPAPRRGSRPGLRPVLLSNEREPARARARP